MDWNVIFGTACDSLGYHGMEYKTDDTRELVEGVIVHMNKVWVIHNLQILLMFCLFYLVDTVYLICVN